MERTVKLVSLAFGIVLLAAETIILIKTDKYYPLSIDDYLVAVILIAAFFKVQSPRQFLVYPLAWAFVTGNMYAMLFGRLDPVYGSGQRIGLLVVVNILAAGMLYLSVKHYLNNRAGE